MSWKVGLESQNQPMVTIQDLLLARLTLLPVWELECAVLSNLLSSGASVVVHVIQQPDEALLRMGNTV